jgi:hypothetical protein
MLTLQRLEDAFQETYLMQASWVSDGITFFTAELIQTLTRGPCHDVLLRLQRAAGRRDSERRDRCKTLSCGSDTLVPSQRRRKNAKRPCPAARRKFCSWETQVAAKVYVT